MPLTPLSLQGYDLSNPDQAKQYQYQLMQFLNGLLSQFNTLQGQVAGQATNLSPSTSNLGALSGNTAFDAKGSLFVSLTFSFAVALTLTINNLPLGAILQLNVTNSSAGVKILTGAANTPANVAYTSWLVDKPTAQANVLTGWTIAATTTFFAVGLTMTGPSINQVAN